MNESKDAWFDIDYRKDSKHGSVELRKRDFHRLGDVSAWLTSDAFDLKEARSSEAEQAMRAAMELAKNPNASKSEVQKVERQLSATLSDTDRFWTRWVAFKESQKGMIPVAIAPEPASFKKKVSEPGRLQSLS